MRSTPELRSTVLLSALAFLLSTPVEGVVVKVDLYRKNSNLDKSKARAARNVLCESCPPSAHCMAQQSQGWRIAWLATTLASYPRYQLAGAARARRHALNECMAQIRARYRS